jgi:hypothetical protein
MASKLHHTPDVNQHIYNIVGELLVNMESSTRPDAPEGIAQYIAEGLDRQDAESLREIASHAEDLAAWKEAQAAEEMEEEDVIREDSAGDDDRPDDIPAKASVVVKEINNNRYYYYQWREGSSVKSEYKAPVEQSE